MIDIRAGLNTQQEEAVTHHEGPLLIIAGAGTGKTTVITRRIANLIIEEHAQPNEILALTFTDKAAGEMEERVDTLLPLGYADLWISTFHAFCERVLSEHALDIGLSNDFRLMNDTEQWLLLREHLDDLELDYYRPKGNPTKFVQALVSHFSRLKDEDITPEDYMAYAEGLQADLDGGRVPKKQTKLAAPKQQTIESAAVAATKRRGKKEEQTDEELHEAQVQEAKRVMEVARAYAAYQQLLREQNAMDFGDLIVETIHLFQQRPAILEKYREQFKYIVVDEFQDTNYAQYDLIKLLAAPKNNITVVADDDQSIYSFRGASMSNILIFKKDYPDAKEVSLIENYRSKQGVLDLAYEFIRHNNPNRLEATLGINKKLHSNNEGESIIEHLHSQSLEGEAHLVMKKILELKQADPELPWSEIAILVRANDHATTFIPYLERAEIPYQFFASQGLFTKPLIIDVISTLKLLENFHDSRSMYRFLTIPAWGVAHEDVMALLQQAKKQTLSLHAAARNASAVEGMSEGGVKKMGELLALLDQLALDARTSTAGEILLQFMERSGYLQFLTNSGAEHAEEQTLYLNQFFKYIELFERGSREKTVRNFILELQMMIDSGDQGRLQPDFDQGPDAVKIMTIHASKGLEFEHVFVVNLVDKRFPSIGRKETIQVPNAIVKDIIPEGDHHIEEERRLFYVAVTRAKTGLYLTSGENYGGARKKKPSQFLVECGFADTAPEPTGDVLFGLERPSGKMGNEVKKEKQLLRYIPNTFSFSQLEAYETCPWQYRFAFLLRVPVPASASASFGRSIHATLYEFFRRSLERSQNVQANLFADPIAEAQMQTQVNAAPRLNTTPTKDELLRIYDEQWLDEWYDSERQKTEYKAKGKEALEKFYDIHEHQWPEVLKLEQVFTMPIGDYKLKGAIDRIDSIATAEDGTQFVSVIDYKTGKTNAKKDPRQLYIYAMALQEVFQMQPAKLQYYFIEENVPVETDFDPKKMEKTREWVLSMIEKIVAGDFAPTPGFHCKYCDFRDICEYRQA